MQFGMGISAAGRALGHTCRLPGRLEVTKVQLRDMHLRNLDKAWRCVTFENGSPSASAGGTCSSPAPGRGEAFLDNPWASAPRQ